MGYQASPSGKTYRLIFQSKGSVPRNIKKGSPEAMAQGFRPEMSLEEAKKHALTLKADIKVKQLEEKKGRINARLEHQRTIECAYLPANYTKEFEEKRKEQNDFNVSHWTKAQEIIRKLSKHPRYWGGALNSEAVYQVMIAMRGISPRYAKKIRHYLNAYGDFYCMSMNTYFSPILKPKPKSKTRLEACRIRGSGKSVPLRPWVLANAREQFTPEEYNWLQLSVWFGLRPREVDSLCSSQGPLWLLYQDGLKVALRINQEKLLGLGVEDAWKSIPVWCPEQKEALKGIPHLKRPINLKLQKVFGAGMTCYGGRQGFVALVMKQNNNDIYITSKWMGHKSVATTQKHYEEVQYIYWNQVA